MMTDSRTLAALFFVSGAAALIYQVLFRPSRGGRIRRPVRSAAASPCSACRKTEGRVSEAPIRHIPLAQNLPETPPRSEEVRPNRKRATECRSPLQPGRHETVLSG
jgi:hypothetical protein